MRIIIDADACPKTVREICQKATADQDIPLLLVADRAHDLDDEADETVSLLTVDTGRDAGDYRIAAIAGRDDLIVTSDTGLAAILLDRVTAVLNPRGFVYSHANIDTLLYSRYLNAKARRGGHFNRIRRRTPEEDAAFAAVLQSFLKNLV